MFQVAFTVTVAVAVLSSNRRSAVALADHAGESSSHLAFLAHSHLFSGCTSLLSCRQVRRPFPPPVQRKAPRLAFMQTLSAARPDSRCAAARLPSAYNNSVVMISLMVFCSRRPSVRNAGLDLSLPMKIKVGSPCICTQSPA